MVTSRRHMNKHCRHVITAGAVSIGIWLVITPFAITRHWRHYVVGATRHVAAITGCLRHVINANTRLSAPSYYNIAIAVMRYATLLAGWLVGRLDIDDITPRHSGMVGSEHCRPIGYHIGHRR